MAPSCQLQEQNNVEEKWDLIKSIAEIANLTPEQVKELLKSTPENKTRKPQGRVTKPAFSRKRHSRRSLKRLSKLEELDPTLLELDDIELPTTPCGIQYPILGNDLREVTHWLKHDDQPNSPEVDSSSRSGLVHAFLYECAQDIFSPITIENNINCDLTSTQPVVTSDVIMSGLEGSTHAPFMLTNDVDYFDPNMAVCQVITIETEQ